MTETTDMTDIILVIVAETVVETVAETAVKVDAIEADQGALREGIIAEMIETI